VATVYGSAQPGYRRALALATASQIAGSLASVLLATALVKAFSGKGLVPPELLSAELLAAVATSAALTVGLATRIGLPISTTHAIVGALVGGGAVIEPARGALVLGAAMALAGMLAAWRVADTLALRITPMKNGQGLAANLATSLLVVGASRFGLPVSTTHVSTGGIFGIGAATGTLRHRQAGGILFAWLGTLPLRRGARRASRLRAGLKLQPGGSSPGQLMAFT
jgi:phosphate/sulfate permease